MPPAYTVRFRLTMRKNGTFLRREASMPPLQCFLQRSQNSVANTNLSYCRKRRGLGQGLVGNCLAFRLVVISAA